MYYKALIDGLRIWNKKEEIESILLDLEKFREEITGVELSSNSLGFEPSLALSEQIALLPNLVHVNYRDIFVGRIKTDLPKSLFELVKALENKQIKVIDLSDNAFGPSGVEAFEAFLKNTEVLKELHLENNGLGPEGAEIVANALISNPNLQLEVIIINRNRLENKGAKALASVLTQMKSVKRLEVFQNGIREEGMQAIIEALAANSDLEYLKLNDNYIKEASESLIKVLPLLTNLKEIDISDSLIGDEYSVRIFETFAELPNLERIYCNYNEIESKNAQRRILEICLQMPKLIHLELKGNEISSKLWSEFKKKFKGKKEVVIYSDEEDIEEIEDEEEEAELTHQLEKIHIK